MSQILYTLLIMLNEMSPYILLGFFIAGLLHAFIPAETMSRHFAGNDWKAVVKAALVGVPLPLCSCGVLPTAVSMRRNGASNAATTSFLIATPQTGVDSIAATYSLLGAAFAVIRPVAALLTALFGGCLVALGDKHSSPSDAHDHDHDHDTVDSCSDGCCAADSASRGDSFGAKIVDTFRYGFVDMVQSIGKWLVIGLVIAALITVLVPNDFLASLGSHPLLAMIAVLIIAIPMYVCTTGSIPIALSLMLKGLSPGTAFVLLMAGPAANFASVTVLSRTLGRKAAALYLVSIIVGAIAFGLAIDHLMPASWFTLPIGSMHTLDCHHEHIGIFSTICSAILVILLVVNLILYVRSNKKINTTQMTRQYKIKGMSCPHCKAAVERGIAAIPGVNSVVVNLADGIATVDGDVDPETVRATITSLGYDPE